MAENKKDKSAEFARDKSAFSKGGSEKGTVSQKVQHKHSGHISQEMQMTLPEMFRKRNSLKLLDRMSRSRGIQQNAEIKSSIRSRTLLDTVKILPQSRRI